MIHEKRTLLYIQTKCNLRDVTSSIDSTICDVHFALSGSSLITLLHSGIEMIQAKKTNAPRVICARGLNNDNSKDSWLIAVRYYVTKGQKGTDRKTCGYATESEAIADSARFRHFLESSSRKHRPQWKQSTDATDGIQSLPVYSRIDCRNSIGVLSATELVLRRVLAHLNWRRNSTKPAASQQP